MKIKFIRLGNANNSSSSHSIIFVSDEKLKLLENSFVEGGEYGWNEFILKDKYEKELYLLAQLYSNYDIEYKDINNKSYYKRRFIYFFEWMKLNNIDELFNFIEKDIFNSCRKLYNLLYNVYIDHQSKWTLPLNIKTNNLDILFIKQLYKWILDNNNIIIFGGNDNDGIEWTDIYNDNDQFNKKCILDFLQEIKENSNMIRSFYDEKTKDWIIQIRNEDIYRLSFENDEETNKSTYPYLVDIKITDFCNLGCPFCYQSSTTKGKHANLDNVKNYLDILRENNVFEIVLGGGEPTQHPEIVDILEYSKLNNFTVGLTTKNYNLDKHPQINNILKNLDTMAISLNNINDIEKVNELCNILTQKHYNLVGYDKLAIYIQSVWNIIDGDELNKILTLVDENYHIKGFTLLGYKDFGFGLDYNKKNVGNEWIDIMKEFSKKIRYYQKFGIDAVMVKQYYNDIIKAGVDKIYLSGEEGKFSCYLDCVDETLSASSYNDNTHKFKPLDNNFLEIFTKF